jgi:hypothetical protein
MQQTQRPPAEGAKVRDWLPPYNVEAEFGDMHSARLAVEALGKAGIEGDHISVTGRAADEAAEPPDADLQAKTREIDASMAKYMVSVIGAWTVGGVIAGALLGIPVSIGLMAALGADVTLERVIAGVFLTALAVGIVSWLIPQTSYGPQAAPPWELTFAESAEGPVKVGVHSENPADIDLAEKALRQQNPLRVYRAGPDGKPSA